MASSSIVGDSWKKMEEFYRSDIKRATKNLLKWSDTYLTWVNVSEITRQFWRFLVTGKYRYLEWLVTVPKYGANQNLVGKNASGKPLEKNGVEKLHKITVERWRSMKSGKIIKCATFYVKIRFRQNINQFECFFLICCEIDLQAISSSLSIVSKSVSHFEW